MAIDRYSYPFTAIVGQDEMKLALVLNAINPTIGGVLIRGEKGTGKSTAVRALARLLPEQKVVEGCHFGCHPEDPEDWCLDCRERAASGSLPSTTRRMRVVELPINASEDRVVGTIDLEAALKEGSRRFEPGVLAEANRNILYVDEVNLLDDHIVDVLLDAAAMGINTVEREGVSVSHPSRFILVGTMNPEEGELRPQLLDRFGLCVDVEGIRDLDKRVAIVEKRAVWEDDPNLFYQQHAESEQQVRSQIAEAIATFPEVTLPREILRLIAQISIALEVDGHRSDLVCARAAQAKAAYDSLEQVEGNIHRVIVGKDRVVRLALAGLVAGGHVLLQDLPGTGKTMLARALATSVGGTFRRIQSTPDLLPSDITGSSVFNQKDLSFEFVPGPIFANIVLADEVNRATPRTPSALLEAMGEGQVTVEGTTRVLDRPFFVVATQNPAEFHGTYPLPESQLDRFVLAAEMGPPTDVEAMEVLARREHGDPIAELSAVIDIHEVVELQEACLRVVAAPAIRTYIVALMQAIRARPDVVLPASMRAGVYLQRAAQAWALFEGRDFVLPDDVKLLATPVLAHRLGMRGRGKAADMLGEVVSALPIPPLRQH